MPPGIGFFPRGGPQLRFLLAIYGDRSVNLSLSNVNHSTGWQNVIASRSALFMRPSIRQKQRRTYSSQSDKPTDGALLREPSQDQPPHKSEEATTIDKIVGEKCDGANPGSPEFEQGTPIDEILRRDKDAMKYAPKVMQGQMAGPQGSRTYSTSATLGRQELLNPTSGQRDSSVSAVADMIAGATWEAVERNPGLKFEIPLTPLPKTEHVKRRYDPLVEQFTKLLMRDGKLSAAQKNMALILDHLRISPPPQQHSSRRLLSPLPAPQLPLNPILYLTLIVDSVAPLMKIRQQKGIAGGGAALQIPVPLALRQRRRTAIKWILDAADKRRDSRLAQRVASELVAAAEGRSGVWEKREQVHKIGTAGRSNLKLVAMGGR